MTDALFAARAQFRLETGYRGALAARPSRTAAKPQTSVLRDKGQVSPAARELARQSSRLGTSAGKLSSAAGVISGAHADAKKISDILAGALELIRKVLPVSASAETRSGSSVSLTGSRDIASPGSLLPDIVNDGQTLTFQVNDGAVQTITFGTGAGEVSTADEFAAALGALTGLNAAIDASGRVTVNSAVDTDTITIGGTADAQAAFGLAGKTHKGVTVTPGGSYPLLSSAKKAIYTALAERLAEIAELVESASSTGDPNLIDGQTVSFPLSRSGGAETDIGGYRLAPADLGLAGLLNTTLASSSGISALRGKFERALESAGDAVFGLSRAERIVDAHQRYNSGAAGVYDDAAKLRRRTEGGYQSSLPSAISRNQAAGKRALALRSPQANAAREGPSVAQAIQLAGEAGGGLFAAASAYGVSGGAAGRTVKVL